MGPPDPARAITPYRSHNDSPARMPPGQGSGLPVSPRRWTIIAQSDSVSRAAFRVKYIFGRLGSRAPRGPGRPGPPARQAVTVCLMLLTPLAGCCLPMGRSTAPLGAEYLVYLRRLQVTVPAVPGDGAGPVTRSAAGATPVRLCRVAAPCGANQTRCG